VQPAGSGEDQNHLSYFPYNTLHLGGTVSQWHY
jgi:hypothetical protein